MREFHYRLIPLGSGPQGLAPINIAFINIADLKSSGVSVREAIMAVAVDTQGPVGINVFDMDAITTTSDGIVAEGAIVVMAAADNGKVHPEFGLLHMAEIEVTDALIEEEPHLLQAKVLFSGRKLFRGPDPATKKIPVHNAVITGRTVNNNSATEMMNIVTMEEVLLPIMGQLQLMHDKEVLFGLAGEFISVGIGMTVAEKFGRIFPFRQFRAGDTAHSSGDYSKTLKKNIPCIVAPKKDFAQKVIRALEIGMIPGLHLGCSPAIIAIAQALGHHIQTDNITTRAKEELFSVGIDIDLPHDLANLTVAEVIEQAEKIVPGVDRPIILAADDIVVKKTIKLE